MLGHLLCLGIFAETGLNEWKKGFTRLIWSVAPLIAIWKSDPSFCSKKCCWPTFWVRPCCAPGRGLFLCQKSGPFYFFVLICVLLERHILYYKGRTHGSKQRENMPNQWLPYLLYGYPVFLYRYPTFEKMDTLLFYMEP